MSFPKYLVLGAFDVGNTQAKFVIEANLIQGVILYATFFFIREILSTKELYDSSKVFILDEAFFHTRAQRVIWHVDS